MIDEIESLKFSVPGFYQQLKFQTMAMHNSPYTTWSSAMDLNQATLDLQDYPRTGMNSTFPAFNDSNKCDEILSYLAEPPQQLCFWVKFALGSGSVSNDIATAGYGGGIVVVIVVLFIGGRVAIAARGVISCGSAGVSARATVAAAVIDVRAGSGIGPIAAVIGVVGSAAVDVREYVGNVSADGDGTAVAVSDIAVGGTTNAVTGAVIAIIANVVNCGYGSSIGGSVVMSTAATASSASIARVY
ncbi:Hypothetical predicted protein [Octopus vulgaris]|uniref:Uncharacterized protein n=1 Tax=Octopus vulgaris TaxID=6645 RepID=A0AA36EZR2_OCTVU|nr:Hypothetical predicted protein [Octopus vulgaris]